MVGFDPSEELFGFDFELVEFGGVLVVEGDDGVLVAEIFGVVGFESVGQVGEFGADDGVEFIEEVGIGIEVKAGL